MTDFEVGIVAPFVEALGWTLVHFVWQGAAIGVIFAVLMRMCRHTSPNLRYVLGLACMVALLLMPIATYWYVYQVHSIGGAEPLAATTPMMLGQALGLTNDAAAQMTWVAAVEAYISAYLPWIVMAWGFGVFLLSLRVCIGWWRLEQLSREGVAPLTDDLQQRVLELCQTFGIRQAVSVLESSRVGVPTVMGWLKPVILMPTSCLIGLSREQLELVIAHELGHIRRWDYLVNLLQVLIETVLFYHPVVRWISRRVREEREQCCDDLVLRHCGKPVPYAKALANLETIRRGWLEPALAATGGQLVTRIERIVGGTHRQRSKEAVSGNSLVLALIVAVVVVLSQVTQQPLEQVIALPPAPVTPASQVTKPELAVSQPAQTPTFSAPPTPVLREIPVTQTREQKVETDSLAKSPTVDAGAVPSPVVDAPLATSKVELASRAPEVPALTEIQVAGPKPVMVPEQAPQAVQQQAGPVALKRVAPNYPRRARVSGMEGVVTVEFSVDFDGTVSNITVLESHPRRVFDREAKRAIAKWMFDPATVTSATSRLTQVFEFSLNQNAAAAPKPRENQGYRTCNRITGTRICLEDEF